MTQGNRVVLPGLPHFIAQEGLGEPVFRESADYRVFLHLLQESCNCHQVVIWGHMLRARGYKLIVVPASAAGLCAALRQVDSEYAIYHNLRHMVRGAVWKGPFQSAAMCWSQVWDALVFLEREPVRTDGLSAAWAHPWSSAAARLGRVPRAPWLRLEEWERQYEPSQWQNRLQAPANEIHFGLDLANALQTGGTLGEMLAAAPLFRKGPQRAGGVRIVKRTPAAGQIS